MKWFYTGLLTCLQVLAAGLPGLPGHLRASVMSGGEWEMVCSLPASAGVHFSTSQGMGLNASIGEPCASTGTLAFSSDTFLSGYLSQIPPTVLIFSLDGITSSAAFTHQGIAYGIAPDSPIKIFFANDVSSTSLPESIKVTKVLDRMANVVASTHAFSVSYSGSERSASISHILGNWPCGATFSVFISTKTRDINGLTLNNGATYYFSVLRDFAVDNVIADADNPGTRVGIPAHAYSQFYFLVISSATESDIITAANSKLIRTLGGGRKPCSLLHVEPYDAQGDFLVSSLQKRATLHFPYKDDTGDGIVDGTIPPIRAKKLSIWWLDEPRSLWVRQSGSTVDTLSKRVSVSVKHFSTYATIGQLDTNVSNVYAYPVPFRPNSGRPSRYGSWTTGIRFINLPSEGTIRIYTVSGRLVRKISFSDDPGEIPWDVKNRCGQRVASGLYIWEVKSGDNRKTGKLVVIK